MTREQKEEMARIAKLEIKRAEMHEVGKNPESLVTMADIRRSVEIGKVCRCGRCYCCFIFQEMDKRFSDGS
jgi:hypothetical protein